MVPLILGNPHLGLRSLGLQAQGDEVPMPTTPHMGGGQNYGPFLGP